MPIGIIAQSRGVSMVRFAQCIPIDCRQKPVCKRSILVKSEPFVRGERCAIFTRLSSHFSENNIPRDCVNRTQSANGTCAISYERVIRGDYTLFCMLATCTFELCTFLCSLKPRESAIMCRSDNLINPVLFEDSYYYYYYYYIETRAKWSVSERFAVRPRMLCNVVYLRIVSILPRAETRRRVEVADSFGAPFTFWSRDTIFFSIAKVATCDGI